MGNPNWTKGKSGNPAGRPKTAFKDTFDNLKAQSSMINKANQILNEEFEEIFYALCDQAKAGNHHAASLIFNYVLGKPKDTVVHDMTSEAKSALTIFISKDESVL
jgi:flagellar hook-basal body complex protein FliE